MLEITFFCIVDAPLLPLRVYEEGDVAAMVERLALDPRFNSVLILEGGDSNAGGMAETGEDPELGFPQGTGKWPEVSNRYVEGKKPGFYPKQRFGGLAPECLGLATMEQLIRLTTYLHTNGSYNLVSTPNDGNCLFAAVLSGIKSPDEYTYTHLRRQVVAFLAENAEYFVVGLDISIMANYGMNRMSPELYEKKLKDQTLTANEQEDYEAPGPFSYYTYLKYMLQDSSWGDEVVLVAISNMWQVGITVLNGESLTQVKLRHQRPIEGADLLLVRCGGNHYLGTYCTEEIMEEDKLIPYKDLLPCLPVENLSRVVKPEEDNVDMDKDVVMVPETRDSACNTSLVEEVEPRTSEVPSVPPKVGSNERSEEMLEHYTRMHDLGYELAKGLGRDPCEGLKERKKDTFLKRVKSEEVTCQDCGMVMSNVLQLNRHRQRQHISVSDFKCEICGKYFPRLNNLKYHSASHMTHTCKSCGREFKKAKDLAEHEGVHNGKVFLCEFGCGKSYIYKRGLRDHMKRCLLNPTPPQKETLPCSVCGKVFSTKRSIRDHMRNVHKL